MKIHKIKIYDTTNLDDQLEESMQEVYSKLESQKKVAMTIWLKFYELQNNEIRLLKSELETLEQEILYLREKGRSTKQKEEEFDRLLEEYKNQKRKIPLRNI